MKLTTKQEKYACNIFSGMSNHEAYLQAGYSGNASSAVIDVNASRLANSTKVLLRIDELRKQISDDKIMPVQERKERLSEIARGRLTDYQEAGLDGAGYISITKDSPNTAAISGIESATKFDENGNTGTLFTKVRLHSPTQAIDLLNKMDKIYSDTVINIDNRKVEISGLTDEQLEAIANRALRSGERVITEKASS